MARQQWISGVRQGAERRTKHRKGLEWQQRIGSKGRARRGSVWRRAEWTGSRGMARTGLDWCGAKRLGEQWSGSNGLVRWGGDPSGLQRQQWLGRARTGLEERGKGEHWYGLAAIARQGLACSR
jgi:hypothetical protein